MTRDAVAELARFQTYPRHITPSGLGVTQRCPNTTGSQQDVYNLGGLYHSHPGSSKREAVENLSRLVTNGNEFPEIAKKILAVSQ